MKRILVVGAVLAGSFVIPVQHAAAATDLKCTGSYSAATYANVYVPEGSWCTLTNVTITGNLQALPHSDGLDVSNSTIDGNLQANNVQGNNWGGTNSICGVKILGNLQIAGSGHNVNWAVDSSGLYSWCGNNCICTNPAPTKGTNTYVGGNLQLTNNRGTIDVNNTDVEHNVQCLHNYQASGSWNYADGLVMEDWSCDIYFAKDDPDTD